MIKRTPESEPFAPRLSWILGELAGLYEAMARPQLKPAAKDFDRWLARADLLNNMKPEDLAFVKALAIAETLQKQLADKHKLVDKERVDSAINLIIGYIKQGL